MISAGYYGQTDRQTDRQADRERERERQTDRQRVNAHSKEKEGERGGGGGDDIKNGVVNLDPPISIPH